jgi:acyl-homoserine-lactone acylase
MQKFILMLCTIVLISCSKKESYTFKYPIDVKNVEIYRDEYGVPHIFGKTDADVAYGLAWANAEDAFNWMQEAMLAGSGKMGRNLGKDGASADFFTHFIGAKELVAERYESEVSEEMKRYIEGYTQGVNAFAAKHPEKVLYKGLFPTTPQVILQNYIVSMSFLVDASKPIQDILDGNMPVFDKAVGSNAFAVSRTKSTENQTYLCINPHFMVDGPLSFYEAHVNSQEGLNFHGVMFQGMMAMIMGNNENLGYGMTYNHFDGVDVYKLKMVEGKKLTYQIDEKEYPLEKRPIYLKVKIAKWLTIPVKRTTYWSEIGPVLKSKDGNYYAIRFWANKSLRLPEQLLKMSKSKNMDEFKAALDIQALAMFNIVYADKEDNIYYLSNGHIPKRKLDDSLNYEIALDGGSSDNIWDKILTIEELPQVKNPECGYVFNANNSPFNATCRESNKDRTAYHPLSSTWDGENNRSERLREIFNENEKFDFAAIKAIKFDTKYPKESKFLESIQALYQIDATKYPDLAPHIVALQNWDRVVTNESVAAAWSARTFQHIFNKNEYTDKQFITGFECTEAEIIEAIQAAKDSFQLHFGKLNVTKGELMRIKRGDKDFPDPGFPDLLAASYGKEYGDGTYVPMYSDSYAHAIAFDSTGPVKMETLVVFGPSSDPEHPRSTIEMERYSKQQMKSMTLKREDIVKDASKMYHPE